MKHLLQLAALLTLSLGSLRAADSSSLLTPPPHYGPGIASLIENDDASQLSKLLLLGLDPNGWVTGFEGATKMPMLEYACWIKKPEVIKALVAGGADTGVTKNGEMQPIEILLEAGRKDLAALLERPTPKLSDDALLEMIAIKLLSRNVFLDKFQSAKDYLAIKLNGKPISDAMLTVLSKGKFSRMQKLESAVPSEALSWNLEVEFEELFGRDDVRFRSETGGSLSGGIAHGKYQRRFGYWLLKDVQSADK